MPSNFGSTPTTTTTLSANEFPVSAGFVPNTASGNLTSLQLGPASTDNNGYISAPVATYTPDGNSLAEGATTDAAVTGDVSGSISAKLRGLSKIFAQLQFDGSNFLKINISAGTVAATQSGTWNINNISGTISLPIGAAQDATVAKLAIAQSTALGSNTGPLVQGSVTTGSPTYTTGNINPLSLTTAGALRVDGSSTVQPVSGTFWQATQPVSAASLPLPAGASTSAKQPALGTAGSASTDVLTVQGITSMTPLKVDGSSTTQPVSGTVTANAGTGNFTVVQGTGSNLHAILDSGSTTAVTQATASNLNAQVVGSVASGSSNVGNPVKAGGAYNSTQPTVTTGQIVDLQASARGALIVTTGVDAFAVNASQSGTWNITNVSGTVSLPTGAATSAKQPVLGTAGSASSDVLTVQGIASMTALKVDGSAVTQPVSGTVSITANGAVNVAQIGGTNVITGGASGLLAVGGPVASGSSNADNPVKMGGAYNSTQPTVTTGQIVDAQMTARGAQIVATGTDTFTVTANAGTNLNTSALALESGGNLATLAGGVSSSKYQANVAQINGVAPTMGNGVSGTGVQRVTIASDSTGQVTLAVGSNTIGAVTQASGPWTQNLTQVSGSALSNTNPIPSQDIEQANYIALTSPPTTTNAGSDTALTFSSQVSRVIIQNNTSANVNFAFDTTASAGSLVLVPGAMLVYPKKCTVLHLYTVAAQNLNGSSAGNLVVLGAL